MRLFNLDRAALALLTSVVPLGTAAAEPALNYPHRPIRLLIGAPPGGETDVLARLVAEHIGQDLGQRVIVEYKPGAANNIAAEVVAHSDPDGYTLFLGGSPNTVHKVMYPSIKYDYVRDLTPLGLVGATTPVLVAGMHMPINSLQDFVQMARERPGELTCGSVGVGSNYHLICEILNESWGVDLRHVPYRGSAAALTDMIGGRIDVQVTVPAAVLPYIKTGKVRPLATLGTTRLPALPDVPTLREAGLPGGDYSVWFGLLAPTATPPEVVERLNQSLNAALKKPKLVETMSQNGLEPASAPNTSAEFKKLIASETEFWTGILHKHGIGPADAGGKPEGAVDQTGAAGDSAN